MKVFLKPQAQVSLGLPTLISVLAGPSMHRGNAVRYMLTVRLPSGNRCKNLTRAVSWSTVPPSTQNPFSTASPEPAAATGTSCPSKLATPDAAAAVVAAGRITKYSTIACSGAWSSYPTYVCTKNKQSRQMHPSAQASCAKKALLVVCRV